ncbi:hypothetical protein HMPREF1991_02652 [Hoylesella loescheii DSM 19665 = JCM 12249 = ATCC 15930]|uniref:Uncharacterized protein n=1 Tax=Hoylesella loescheii DSM 19665 = JCM 12249 = ATCC 15930 TaxID=1122985 RepID=A0A069QEH4_HOYLO|nr:hypothetical protein HMPREF1991_02652 [Hoylesella loescheii DSM 19665 = JCM 12249 = ATCC 15930]
MIGRGFGVKQHLRFAHYRMTFGVVGREFVVKQRLYFAHYRIAFGVIDVSLE